MVTEPTDVMFGADDIYLRFLSHLKAWTPTYIAEVSRQAALAAGALPPFRSWEAMADFTLLPEHLSPACVVVADGLDDVTDQLHGDEGWLGGRWAVSVSVFVQGRDQDSTRLLVGRYVKAVRGAIMRQRAGLARTVQLVAEAYDALPTQEARTIGGGTVVFDVHVDAVQNVTPGRLGATPPVDPLAPWPSIPTVAAVTVPDPSPAIPPPPWET